MSDNKKRKKAHKIESFQKQFDQLQKQIKELNMKIDRIHPVYPTAPSLSTTICSKCGMKRENATGYSSCYLQDCPFQIKPTSHTYNTSKIATLYDIESPNPAEFSWYYNGVETKGNKE